MTEIPAGWYDDPEDASQYRYWDGTGWTEHRAPRVARPSMADADATAVLSRAFDLLKATWTKQLAFAAIAAAGVAIGAVLAVTALVSSLDPDIVDIVDRITDPSFNPDSDPADEAFLESISFDASPASIVAMVIGVLIAGLASWLGAGIATAHVASVNAGVTDRSIGASFRYGLRNFPRWVGISMLWTLCWGVAMAALVGIHVLLYAVTPALLFVLVVVDVALIIYGWPYWAMMTTTLVVAPRDVGPFRRTVSLVRPRWPGIAGRVLLVSVVVFAVNLAGNVLGIIPVIGLLLIIPLTFAVYAFQVAANVVLYEYLEGPLDPELTSSPSRS